MKISKEQFPVDWNVEFLDYYVQKGDIKLDRGKVISSIMMNVNPGTFPVYSSSAKENALFGTWGNYLIDEELISWSVDGGGYFFYRPKHKFSVTNVSGILRADTSKFDIRFLYYFLDWQHSKQTFNYQDKAHPSVIRKKYFISQVRIKEQSQIAHILSTIDNNIAFTEKLIAKYQRIKTGLIFDLLTRGIDENGNLRSEETHQFKDSLLGRIPIEWNIYSLKQALIESKGYIQTGPFGSQLHSYEYLIDGKVPVIMPQDINETSISTEKIARISEEKANNLSRHRVKLNDTIFARRGDISRIAVISEHQVGWFCGTGCILMRSERKGIINPTWFTNFYKSFLGQNQIKANAVGLMMVNLNSSVLNNLLLFKLPYHEQNRIVISLRNVEKMHESLINNLNKFNSLKTGLMQDLLSGKVRLPEELLLREGIE